MTEDPIGQLLDLSIWQTKKWNDVLTLYITVLWPVCSLQATVTGT